MMEEKLEFAQNLKEKLRTNASLTGSERAFIMHLITFSDDAEESESSEKKRNRKIQCVLRNVKDSCSQTDNINDSTSAMSASKRSRNQQDMNESYDDRRILIFTTRPSVTEIKEKYPDLFSTCEIRKELDRIFYPGKSNEFLGQIEKYASIILECGKHKKLYHHIKVILEEAKNEHDQIYALQVGAILILPALMYQNADRKSLTFIRFKIENPNEEYEPYILVNTSELRELCLEKHLCKVIVEGVKVGETYSFIEAVLIYFACFFIFDIVYPDKDINTHIAMERLFLNVKESEEIDGYASEMIKRLISSTR